MLHKGTIRLETERLVLRQFTEDDVQSMYENWASDERVTEFLRWSTHSSAQVSKQLLDEWVSLYKMPDFYQWAIVLKELGDDTIGAIGVTEIDEKLEKVQIGYCIGSSWWNHGYTSEAFTAVIAFLFKQIQVNRIEAQHDPANPGSGAVMRKCGLRYEGTLRQADYSNRGIVDTSIWSILASEHFS